MERNLPHPDDLAAVRAAALARLRLIIHAVQTDIASRKEQEPQR